MVEYGRTAPAPLLSIVIAVYNDWVPLNQCLRSLAGQTNAPSFEVIIVDDGSRDRASDSITDWGHFYPLAVCRQTHAGIPAARNAGIRVSTGSMLVFIDADCKLQTDCLAALRSSIEKYPRQNCFQLRLAGEGSTLVGRSEDLRLITLQENLLLADGRIRYLNTAGFAIRREKVDVNGGLFDPAAVRGEDTLLLVTLMQRGELPLLVAGSVVQHIIRFGLVGCLLKEVRSAYLERKAFAIGAARGCRVRVSNRDRLNMLRFMWKTSGQRSIGRAAWFVLVTRQSLQRTISFACSCFLRQTYANKQV